MNDLLKELASDPSCLLAITPEGGGSWLAPFRTPQPRNFAAESMTWTDAKTALDATDQSHDFTFEIEFKCVKTNGVYIFAPDGSNDFIRVFMSSGEIIVSTALLSTASGGSTQFSAGSDSTNRHALTVKMIENTITALIDGEIVYTRENLVRNAIEISAPRSNAGYVYKISITDDTTGAVVWQAAYSDLYDTSIPHPSPLLRNFAEEPGTWEDFYYAFMSIGLRDFQFDLKVWFDAFPDNFTPVFYDAQYGVFGLRVIEDTPTNFYLHVKNLVDGLPFDTVSASGATAAAWYNAPPLVLGLNTIRIKRVGATLEVTINGYTITESGSAVLVPTLASAQVIYSNWGNIIDAGLVVDGKVAWHYPSEAERVRLITKTNVRTDQGSFEAADATQVARVDTSLDLRGKVSSYTVVVDFEMMEPDGGNRKQELAGQGASVTGYPSICSICHSLASGNMQLSQEVNGSRQIVYSAPDDQQGRHVAVGVVDVGESTTRLAVYFDGALLKEESFSGIPSGTCDPRATNWALFDNRNGLYTPKYGTIYSCLLFDRALSDSEIARIHRALN